jgi:2-polyprenyl-3-methyl-5-hydroxy-6-metoxy-1,4-benzoquinol methylase
MNNPAGESVLAFTGERFTPECVREIAYEHWHRYAFAMSLAKGKRVLDAACGEGFGAALLASVATQVQALDIDQASILHAQQRYAMHHNLSFSQADISQLQHLPSASVDLIVSFETLEHLEAHEQMLEGFLRLLKPEGMLLISTPDKKNYTDATGVVNPHHVRELYRDEFDALIKRYFTHHKMYTQKLLFQSSLYSGKEQGHFETITDQNGRIEKGLHYPPMYYLAACSNRESVIAQLPDLSLYGDAQESIYTHYYDEIRFGMRARERIAQLEAKLSANGISHD